MDRCTWLILSSLVLLSCAREDPPVPQAPPVPRTVLLVEHRVDQVPLQYGTMLYTNEAGHVYSVSRLEYFLSELVLVGAAGTPDHVVAGPWYINGALGNAFDLGVLPPGSFSGATVQLGLPPALNLSDALPATMAHVNMAWPGPMGGGYHFLKFEGHFLHNGSPTGFAMHLGRNENLVHGAMPGAFTRDGTADSLVLRFNLNEVFRSPHTYDLVTGTQSMGSMVLMGLLRDNTADAFSLEHRP